MKNTFIIILLFAFAITNAQVKEIEFTVDKSKNTITFIGVNNTKYSQEVTLTFPNLKGLKGYKKPIKKIITAKQRTPFITLSYKGAYSYRTSYRYRTILTKEQRAKMQKEILSHKFKGKDYNKGILVFTKNGCSRCKIALDYLTKNKIKYQYINTSEKKENNRLMWSLLRSKGVQETRFNMPVILVDGKVNYKFKSLKGFLATLK